MNRNRSEHELIADHRPLAGHLARRYSPGPVVDEDLLSVANIALVLAAQRFDPGRGFPFHSFAVPTITGEIKRFLRDQTWAVHVPRRVKELALALETDQRAGQQELGRSLTAAELADRLGVDPAEVQRGLEASRSRRSGPLLLLEVGERYVEDSWDRVATFVSIERAMSGLSADERSALVLRYSDDLTQAEIGVRLGVSQPHVHRLLVRALDALRRYLGVDDAGIALSA